MSSINFAVKFGLLLFLSEKGKRKIFTKTSMKIMSFEETAQFQILLQTPPIKNDRKQCVLAKRL